MREWQMVFSKIIMNMMILCGWRGSFLNIAKRRTQQDVLNGWLIISHLDERLCLRRLL